MKKAAAIIIILAVIALMGCTAVPVQEAEISPTPEVSETEDEGYDAAEIFELFGDRVLFIETNSGGGTGFFVEADIIATNNHVIAEAEWITVTDIDGNKYDVTEILARSENPDLAFFKVPFTAAPISKNTHGVRMGEDIYIIGAPMGIYPCISDGIVMKDSHEDNGVNYILSNVHSIGGNSGGPALNAYGELVGVVVGGMSDGPNSIDMLISAEHLRDIEYGEPTIIRTKAQYEAEMNRPDAENYVLAADPSSAEVGMLVSYGRYEQDDDPKNGPEDILWLVKEKNGSELVLMSLYCLDVVPYHNELVDITWENSYIRQFLNGEFFETAFNADEQAGIILYDVVNDPNPVHGTDGGNTTKDRVYLPSLEEIMRYYELPPEETFYDGLYAQATQHTVNKGVWLEIPGSIRCWWWLRSTGGNPQNAAEVGSAGYLSFNGTDVVSTQRAIRPMIRITAE